MSSEEVKTFSQKEAPPSQEGRGRGIVPQKRMREKRYLPKTLRQRLFNEVLKLYDEELRYKEIIEEVQKKYGVSLSMATISCWTRGIHTPYYQKIPEEVRVEMLTTQKLRKTLEPCPELAYVLGAALGDGIVYQAGYNKRIEIKAKDREFIEETATCITIFLGRPVKVRALKNGFFYVKVCSAKLYEILKNQLTSNESDNTQSIATIAQEVF